MSQPTDTYSYRLDEAWTNLRAAVAAAENKRSEIAVEAMEAGGNWISSLSSQQERHASLNALRRMLDRPDQSGRYEALQLLYRSDQNQTTLRRSLAAHYQEEAAGLGKTLPAVGHGSDELIMAFCNAELSDFYKNHVQNGVDGDSHMETLRTLIEPSEQIVRLALRTEGSSLNLGRFYGAISFAKELLNGEFRRDPQSMTTINRDHQKTLSSLSGVLIQVEEEARYRELRRLWQATDVDSTRVLTHIKETLRRHYTRPEDSTLGDTLPPKGPESDTLLHKICAAELARLTTDMPELRSVRGARGPPADTEDLIRSAMAGLRLLNLVLMTSVEYNEYDEWEPPTP